MEFSFKLEANDATTEARAGRLTTAHGVVETPVFMPVGTAGSVKTLTPDDLKASGVSILLANTYHLWLRPGVDTVRRLGGLHRFMSWPGSILADSGGFQVMSLAEFRKVSENGVEFRSHLDGARCTLTPEEAIRIQDGLGTDIAMSFDEPVEMPAPPEAVSVAVDRTVRWAARGLEERERLRQDGRGRMALFGINQGGVDANERARCFEGLREMPFDGWALGGLWVGEGRTLGLEMVERLLELSGRTGRAT
jgi:queuine tRNA-ribosyltransferase